MARKRDYKKEEEARNAAARELGFANRYEMRKALENKRILPVKSRFTAPELFQEMLNEYLSYPEQRYGKAKQIQKKNSRAEISIEEMRELSAEWSEKHSRQRITKYRKSFSNKRVEHYYYAFVKYWELPNDERNFYSTYTYMNSYGNWQADDWEDDPYRHTK